MFEKLKTSLRAQLTVILILIVLVTIILGSLTVISRITPDLKTQQAKHLKMISQVKQNEFRNYLIKHIELLGITGNCNLVVEYFQKAQKILKTKTKNIQKFSTIKKLIQNWLNTPLWKNKNLYFIDYSSGIIFNETERNSDFGKSIYEREFNQSPLKEIVDRVFRTNQIQILPFSYYSPLGGPGLFIATPVFDPSSRLLGTLVLLLSSKQFKHILNQDIEMTHDYEFYITDQNGNIIFFDRSLKLNENDKYRLKIAHLKNLTSPTKVLDYKNKEALLVVAPIDIPEVYNTNINWLFITQIEYETFLTPIYSFIKFVIILSLFILIVGIVLALYLGKKVVLPIQRINNQLQEFEHGNLSIEIPLLKQKNEFGQLTQNLKRVVERLHDQIRDIMDNINVIASSTNEISATVAQITASSSETATAITQTASSAEEVAHLAEGFNEKAKSSLGIGEQAVEIANKGNQAFESIYKLVQDVKNQMEEVAVTVVDLSKQSQTISEITDAVKEIAEQSNILAINASIEATKAGEYGRGFAVVANEVRNLAEQSKKSTQQIRTILDSIQDAIGKTVMKVEESNKIINTGAQFVEQARSSLFQLAEAIEKLTTVLSEIAEYASEQLTGTAQIKEAMDNIKDATAQNVDSMHQLEEVIQDLKDTGENLKEQISIYKL